MAIGDGLKIAIVFDEDLTGDVTGQESAFTISFQQYNRVPEGSLVSTTRPVISTERGSDNKTLILNFAPGATHSIRNARGDITVTYDSTYGTLRGQGGPVQNFSRAFTPTDLEAKDNPNEVEHLSVVISYSAELKAITYHYTKEDEHLSLNVSGAGVLTYIGDL